MCFQTSRNRTAIDLDKISEEIFPSHKQAVKKVPLNSVNPGLRYLDDNGDLGVMVNCITTNTRFVVNY